MSSSSSLSGILLSLGQPETLVNDLARTLETHIAAKGGISGAAMKIGFNTLRAAKPDIAATAARKLLPDIAKALDPLYAEFKKTQGLDFGSYLSQQAPRAATVVLDAVDARMATIHNTTAKSLYKRFRGSAGDELQKLLPAFGSVLATHIR